LTICWAIQIAATRYCAPAPAYSAAGGNAGGPPQPRRAGARGSVGLCFKFQTVSHRPEASAPAAKPAPAHQALTDEELLALFPDTPVALATLSDGTKRLIFPRAGDDQKFVTRF